MAISVVCFTSHTLILKWVMTYREHPPSIPLLFRALVGSIIVFLLFSHKSERRRPLQVLPVFLNRRLAARGLTGIVGTAAFYYTIPPLGVGKASLLLSTYVLFAALIAAIFLKETLRPRQSIWLTIAFVGIALLLSNRAGTFALSLGFYEILGIFGAIMAATTVVLIRQLTKDFSAGTIFLAQCVWVGIPVFPFAIPHFSDLSTIDYLGLTAVGITAAGGQLFMNEGYRRLSVAAGSSLQNIVPLLITVGGIAFFGERLTILQAVGGVFILLGAFFVSVYRDRKNAAPNRQVKVELNPTEDT